MTFSRFVRYILLGILALSCSEHQEKKQEGANEQQASLELDSLTLNTDPISVNSPSQIKLKTDFEIMLAKVEDSLFIWGFTKRTEKQFATTEEYKNHWFFKSFFRKDNVLRLQKLYPSIVMPSQRDWNGIENIKQVNFTKGWKYVIEEWAFANEKSAYAWLDIALGAKYLDNAKPPRIFWIEGNKMYFIMATASADWSAFGEQIIKLATGKTRWLIQLLNRPLEIKEFKKKAGGANGGPRHNLPFYYKPDTIGTYYEYFWFHALRRQYGENQSIDYLFVETYIYGEKIGLYNKVDEALISIKAKASHRSLGLIDLVGKLREDIEHLYGKAHWEHKGTHVYHHNKSFLILHYIESKVDWFRYIKTNLTLGEINKLPPDYFEYNGRYSKNQIQ